MGGGAKSGNFRYLATIKTLASCHLFSLDSSVLTQINLESGIASEISAGNIVNECVVIYSRMAAVGKM